MIRIHLLPLFFLIPFFSYSQSVEQHEKKAAGFMEKKDFQQALYHLEIVNHKKSGNPLVLTQLGICYFELDKLAKAEYCLFSINATDQEMPPVYYLYLGKIFHARLLFEEAVHHFKLFLKNSKKKEKRRASVKDDILRCANGIMVRRQVPIGDVLLLDSTINSASDEFRPLNSPNRSGTIYFSSGRERNSTNFPSQDIYQAERKTNGWAVPSQLSLTINTSSHEWPLGFDQDGKVLYFFRGNNVHSGDILVDTFTEDLSRKNVVHAEFRSPVRAWEGDCDPHFYDGQTILFASRRAGGFGGLDIYVTKLASTGWTTPVNLGPTINSAYDDRWPFLAPDGHTLYFSTNDARRSIGGTDILKSVFLEQVQKWTPPENLGIPFNSAADDECLVLSSQGHYTLFNSDRKTGFGKRDIYMGLLPETNDGPLQPAAPFVLQNKINEENVTEAKGEILALEFTIYPLPYVDSEYPLPDEFFDELRKIGVLLKKYPQLKIILTGYAAQHERGIISTSAILQEAVLFLKKNQNDLRQIKWLVAAQKYIPRPGGQKSVDPFLANPEILSDYIKVEQTQSASFQAGFFKKAMSGLVYQVQVPTGENVRQEELLKFYPEGMLSQWAAGGPVYFIPDFHLAWSAALEAEKAVQQIGFFDTRVVPVLNGWELDKNSAAQHLHEYPELRYFMERE